MKLCLKSLKETTANLDTEILVIDSTVSHKARDLIKENHPNIKYLPFKENLGYARGVNIGIQNSSGKYILVLNPDVIVTDGAIDKMLNYVQKHADIGMLGPRVLNFNGTHQKTYFSYYKPATILARRSFLGKFGWFKKELNIPVQRNIPKK